MAAWKAWFLAGIGATAAITIGAWWWHWRAIPLHAIIVKPFSGDLRLAVPLRDEVMVDLSRVPGLRILTAPAQDPAATGVLQADVERTTGHVRVVALLSGADGHRYWTRTFERSDTDLPALHEDIAAAVNPKARKKTAPHKAPAQAYESYLEGRLQFGNPEGGGYAQAAARFGDATRVDPDFALAWAWLSMAKEYLADSGAVRPNDVLPAARDAAERAAALDPESAEAHLALGMINLQYDWHWGDAKRELDRALQLSPGSEMAGYWRHRWDQATGHAPPPEFHFANLPAIDNDEDARKLLNNADDIRVETYISAAALALVAARIHDADATFHWLDQAYDERAVELPYVVWSPELPRSDPRLEELMQKMNLGGTK